MQTSTIKKIIDSCIMSCQSYKDSIKMEKELTEFLSINNSPDSLFRYLYNVVSFRLSEVVVEDRQKNKMYKDNR